MVVFDNAIGSLEFPYSPYAVLMNWPGRTTGTNLSLAILFPPVMCLIILETVVMRGANRLDSFQSMFRQE
jgi:hypothetical protein